MTTPWNVRGSAILLAQQELARLAPSLLGKTLLVVGMSQLGVMVLCARWLVSQSWGSLLVGGFLSTLVIAGALYWLAYRPAAQVAAQAAGLPAEAYFQAVVEAVNDAVVVTEGDGSIVFVNPAARLLFGYEPQKLLGQPISSLLPLRASEPEGPAGRPPLLRALQPAAIEGCRQDGSRFPVEVSSRSVSAGEREFTVTVIRDSSERRRTERELARLAAFPQLNPTPVLECDRQGRITYANPAAEGLLRSLWVSDPAAQLLPRGLPELVRRGSQENVPVLNQESTVGAQTFLWSLYPLPELNRIHVHATDISERKEAEHKLEERTIYLNALIEKTPLGIVVTDREGRVTMCNPAFERLFLFPQDEILGANIDRLVTPPGLEAEAERITRRAVSGETFHATTCRRRKDGSRVEVELHAVPLFVGGKLVGGYGLYQDITERKAAEEQLRELSTAIEQTADPVLITKADGSIEYVNHAFEEVTGYTAAEALGKTPAILKSGMHTQEFYERLWSTILAGQPWRGTFVNRKKGGELYFAATSVTPIFSPGRGITHFVSVEKDITERVRTEEELRQSEERFRGLVEALPVAIRVIQQGVMVFSNSADGALFGFDRPEEIIGTPALDYVAEEDVKRLGEYMEARAAGRPAPTRYECRAQRRDGTQFPAELVVAGTVYGGKPASLAVVLDLSERKRLRLFESLLPVCCVCGRVRDDTQSEQGRGAWRSLEEYVIEHADADLSHTFCPPCYQQYRQEQGLPPESSPAPASS